MTRTAHTATQPVDYSGSYNSATESICQHCGTQVAYTRTPADAGYAAFAHTATNKVACG